MLMVKSLDMTFAFVWSLLTAHCLLILGFGFVAERFLDCLTHQLRRGIWIEALKMFHDAAVARDDKALWYHRLTLDQLHQRRGHRAIVPDNSVIDVLRANEILHVPLIIVLVVTRRQSQHDQAAG